MKEWGGGMGKNLEKGIQVKQGVKLGFGDNGLCAPGLKTRDG
jgi:hypothetical protein